MRSCPAALAEYRPVAALRLSILPLLSVVGLQVAAVGLPLEYGGLADHIG